MGREGGGSYGETFLTASLETNQIQSILNIKYNKEMLCTRRYLLQKSE